MTGAEVVQGTAHKSLTQRSNPSPLPVARSRLPAADPRGRTEDGHPPQCCRVPVHGDDSRSTCLRGPRRSPSGSPRPTKLLISGARRPVKDPAPYPGARSVPAGDHRGGIGPVQKQWTVQLVRRSTSPNSPLLRRRQPAKLPVMRQSIRDLRLPQQPGVPCGCAHGPCRSMAAPARCPMRRTAQAQPVGHGVRPDRHPGGTRSRSGTLGQAPSSPPKFPARPRGRGYTSPCPHTPARRTSPRHPSPGRPSDVEAVAGAAARVPDRRRPAGDCCAECMRATPPECRLGGRGALAGQGGVERRSPPWAAAINTASTLHVGPLSHARPALSRLSAAHQRLGGAWSGSIDAPTGPRGPSCRPRTGLGSRITDRRKPANSLPAGPRRPAY